MAYKLLTEYLQSQGFNTTKKQVFAYQDFEIEMSYNQMIEAVVERLRSETQVIEVLTKIAKGLSHYQSIQKIPLKEVIITEFEYFLQEMSIHREFRGELESSWKKLAKDYEMDVKFLKWWAKEKGISEQQMLCDHDNQDKYTEDGNWVNYTNTCTKCLGKVNHSLEHDEDVNLVYKAWKK